ncbi:MAG: F0F1 ATP synthase subunit epsilon [Halanaerobiales bacterium]
MPSTIKLDIVTPDDVVYSEDIEFIEAPAIDGLIGILPRHAPLVTGLKTGVLQIKKGEENIFIPISDGFMEVKPDIINVVVRTAELPHKIDVERAKRAKERAEKRLKKDGDIDFTRAEAALERAIARLKAVDKHNTLY